MRLNEPNTVLIVDDNPNLLRIAARVVTSAGHQALTAATGQAALRLAREKQPDLILLDVVLPDTSGIEVCKQIKADPALTGSLVVLLSGLKTNSDNQAEGLEVGADGYIARPISNRELAARVEAMLRLKRAEAERQASEERYRRLIESSDDLIFSVDRAGVFQTAGGRRLADFGLRPQDVVGRSLYDLFGEEAERYHEQHRQVFESGEPLRYEHAFEFASVTRTDLTTIHPIKNERGEVEQVGVICHDITERKQAEEVLRESETRWRSLAECSPDHILLLDRDLRIEFANYPSPGLAVEDLLGTPLYTYVEEARQAEIQAILEGVLATGQPARYETEFLGPNGTIYYESRCVPRAVAGKTVGLMLTARDITERKRVEAQLQASLRDKDVLIQEVHHRVKNNLQIVSSLLDLQADAIPDPRVQRALENSKHRIRSMAMVHETLYQSPDLARLNLADYVRDLADYLLGAYQGATGVLTLEVQVEDVPLALDQAIPCGLIVTELVSNALKHAFPLAGANGRPAGRRGKLWVVLRAHAGQVELVVGDDGAGLPADLDPQSTRSLGLRLVQLLARQIGGRLEVNRNEGVEFRIVFPAPDHEQGTTSKR